MLDPIWGIITKFVSAILSKRKADKIPPYLGAATNEPDTLSFSVASKNSLSESLSLCIFLFSQRVYREF